MNEQEIRQELRTFLHQGVMQLYDAHRRTVGEDEAKRLISEEVSRIAEYVGGLAGKPPLDLGTLRSYWGAFPDDLYAQDYLYALDLVDKAYDHMNENLHTQRSQPLE